MSKLKGVVRSCSLVFVCGADLGVLAVGLTNQFARHTLGFDMRRVNNVTCKLHVAATHICMDFSIWALCFISIQRLLVIYRPFLFERLFTRRSVSVLLSLLFALVLLKNATFASFFELSKLPSDKRLTCAVHKNSADSWRDVLVGWFEIFVKFLVPFPVQLLCSILLFATLRTQLAAARKLRICRGVQRHASGVFLSTAGGPQTGANGPATQASVVEMTAAALRKSSEEQWNTKAAAPTGRKESGSVQASGPGIYSTRRAQAGLPPDEGRRRSATPTATEKPNGGPRHFTNPYPSSKRNSAAIVAGAVVAASNGSRRGSSTLASMSKLGSSTNIHQPPTPTAAAASSPAAGCHSAYHEKLSERQHSSTSVSWSTSAILLAINLSFLLCHGPINCFNLFITMSGALEKLSHAAAEATWALSQTLFTVQYTNHALNFALYLLVLRCAVLCYA